MMIDSRTTRSHLWTLLLLVGAMACAPAVAPPAAPTAHALPLWEVTDGHGTVYLLGSIHVLRPETYPLDDAIYEAFDSSEVVAFELHLDSLEAGAPRMIARGLYEDGRTLGDVLPADVHADLEAHFQQLGMPVQAVSGMEPWLVALTVTALTVQRAGFETAQGIDRHFFDRATAAGKRITSFETMDQQIRVFDGMPQAEQIAFLRSTLDDIDGFADMLDEATDLWKRGDAEAIAAMMTESMEEQPNLKRRLLDDRNQAWVPQIETLLRSGDTSMVVVGMGHLIGEGSVVDLLRSRGYTITRVSAGAALRPR